MTLGSTQPLTEISTRDVFWGQRRPVSRADNLPTLCADCLILGASSFWSRMGLRSV